MKFTWPIENYNRYKKIACLITVFGVMQFVFLTFLAAFFYPGGYDYFNYYFSDLGAVIARNGEINSISSGIFFIALIVISICFIPFWLISRLLFENKFNNYFSKIVLVLGLLSTPFIITIALCPLDTKFELHLLSSLVVLFIFTIAIFLYSIVIITSEKYSKSLGFIGFAVVGVSIGLMINPFAPYGAFLQKIIFYCYFGWVLIPTFLVWNTDIEKRN
jgi:hypothetical protein